jgi:hypothetical protein
MVFSDDAEGEGSIGSVVKEGDGYCGVSEAKVKVCAFSAPAVVAYTVEGGDAVQYPVESNYFVGVGANSYGEGKGAYDVKAPDDTAADQVRYLVDILNASAGARADLRPVLADLNRKVSGASQISRMSSVADNRLTLRQAVEATPVTEIEGGARLASLLAQALDVSEQTDRLYVTWAEVIRDGKDDKAIVAQWEPLASQSERLKQQFVDLWNSQIAPKYGVQTFTAAQI